jgi:hypothetical protein
MFLLFPESIMIPEMLERLRDSDFEDWLTAALIESANQRRLAGPNSSGEKSSSHAITDLWMLEIAERSGSIWRGSFHVEFEGVGNGEGKDVSLEQPDDDVMSFAIDTDTGELRINAK